MTFWNRCLDSGETPLLLKTSHIAPIYKGGDQGEPSNYRPVALTSQVTKVFEKAIRKKIVHHLDEHDLFNESQHGFRSGRSCLSQLLTHYDTIFSLLEQGSNVDTVYLDFSKAFDKVDHSILLTKLQRLGIGQKLISWIKSFLTDRVQYVLVNGIKSEAADVTSGVPQGSVLGPLLFLIMIGDIDKNIKYSVLSSFADDTRILKEINDLIDTFKLQSDLNAVYSWTDQNNMKLNGDKFEHLKYGKDEQLKSSSVYLANPVKKIKTKDSVRDLGVIMSDDCSFDKHISSVISKANSISGWILRTFESREKSLMLTLWKSIVLPHLDYCSQLWAPLQKQQIQEIEKVQKHFVNKIRHAHKMSYWELLSTFRLYSLERRRERYMVIYIWKILEGLVPNYSNNKEKGGISGYKNDRLGRKCTVPIVKKGPYSKARSASLSVHGPRLFNALPRYLRDMKGCTADSFKEELDKFLRRVRDEPQLPNYVMYRKAASNSIIDMVNIGLLELDG